MYCKLALALVDLYQRAEHVSQSVQRRISMLWGKHLELEDTCEYCILYSLYWHSRRLCIYLRLPKKMGLIWALILQLGQSTQSNDMLDYIHYSVLWLQGPPQQSMVQITMIKFTTPKVINQVPELHQLRHRLEEILFGGASRL